MEFLDSHLLSIVTFFPLASGLALLALSALSTFFGGDGMDSLELDNARGPATRLDMDAGLITQAGLHPDGASAVYQRFSVAAGHHRIVARLRDSARSEGFDHERAMEIDLFPGQNFVIDFRAESGGFIFK